MGVYLNPSNESFRKDKNSQIYVDKTKLIEYLNEKINTSRNCFVVSRARCFGKSHAADMISAYYSKGADSYDLFQGTKITKYEDFAKHLNQYHVIHLDISSFWDYHKDDIIETIITCIFDELRKEYIGDIDYSKNINIVLANIYQQSQIQFVIIIDEWDCLIRNSENQELIHKYLQFLHSLFKSEESKSFLALGYITGILPIKKIEDESALNNFDEYTMLDSYPISQYYGFTKEEVKQLCEEYNMDYEVMKSWYDGYVIDGIEMYNPNSVSMALERRKYNAYWKNTSSFSSINRYITLDFDGLKSDVIEMLAGQRKYVDTDTFQNDLNIISSKDDALTALIHLGYLGYDYENKEAFVPNFEVSKAYEMALKTGSWEAVAQSISRCNDLLNATIHKDEQKVAQIMELAHEAYSSILGYNNEISLSCVLTMAYFTAPAYYMVIRELPTGKGFADFAFIPRMNAGNKPAMIVELKYNQSADTAITQIKEKRYFGALQEYYDSILLVGINYTPDKGHSCIIEEWKQK